MLFSPLLEKYSYLLRNEDSTSQMQLFFLDILHKIPITQMKSIENPVLIRYIQRSLYHEYIRLKKTSQLYTRNQLNFSALSENELRTTVVLLSAEDQYFPDILSTFDAELTDKESFVIRRIFLEGYSVTEVAASTGISRQAINQTKLRALNKLRKKLEFDL